jgi:hypothetical protein
MDLAIFITIACLAFGFGVWFHRITNRLDNLGKQIAPLIILHWVAPNFSTTYDETDPACS